RQPAPCPARRRRTPRGHARTAPPAPPRPNPYPHPHGPSERRSSSRNLPNREVVQQRSDYYRIVLIAVPRNLRALRRRRRIGVDTQNTELPARTGTGPVVYRVNRKRELWFLHAHVRAPRRG